MDRFREVLHDEVEIGRGFGDLDADGALGAANIDDCPLSLARRIAADGGPGIAVDEKGREPPHHIRESGHAPRKTLGHFGMGGVVRPEGLIGVLGKAPAGMLRLVGAPFLPGLEGSRGCLEELVEEPADPRAYRGTVDKHPRGGRVGDEARARLAEGVVVNHCEAEASAEIDEVEAAFGGEVGEGDLVMDGNFGGDVVFVDGLETDGVQLDDLVSGAWCMDSCELRRVGR